MLDNATRIQAARELANLGETQTAVKYLAGLACGLVDRWVPADRMAAVREIAQLSDATTAAQALADLLEDRYSDENYRAAEVREFTQLVEAAVAAQAHVALLADRSIDEKTRAEAVRAIVQIGDNALAVSTLTALAGNAAVADEHRLQAAREIAKLGNTTAAVGAYTALVENSDVDSSDRFQAAEEIAKLGYMAMAIYAYSTVAKDEWAEEEHRIEAAQELLKLGDTLEGVGAIDAVLALTNDIGLDMGFTDTDYRLESALKIAEKGDIDTATNILMEIVKDDDFRGYEDYERLQAARNIAEIGNTAAAIEAYKVLVDAYIQDRDIQTESATELAKLGDAETVAKAYTALLSEFDLTPDQIAHCGDNGTVARLLIMMLEDDSVERPVQWEAYHALLKLVISLDPYFDKTVTRAW